MSQPETVDALLGAFFQERQPQHSLETFVEQAEAAGEHQLAKILRAVIASDTYREKVIRHFLPIHSRTTFDYYVCPRGGLIFEPGPPEHCPADATPCDQFEEIK